MRNPESPKQDISNYRRDRREGIPPSLIQDVMSGGGGGTYGVKPNTTVEGASAPSLVVFVYTYITTFRPQPPGLRFLSGP